MAKARNFGSNVLNHGDLGVGKFLIKEVDKVDVNHPLVGDDIGVEIPGKKFFKRKGEDDKVIEQDGNKAIVWGKGVEDGDVADGERGERHEKGGENPADIGEPVLTEDKNDLFVGVLLGKRKMAGLDDKGGKRTLGGGKDFVDFTAKIGGGRRGCFFLCFFCFGGGGGRRQCGRNWVIGGDGVEIAGSRHDLL